MCEFVNMCESKTSKKESKKKKKEKERFTQACVSVQHLRDAIRAWIEPWVPAQGYKPHLSHTHMHTPGFSLGGHEYTSVLCLHLAIQTAVCCFNVTFMAIQVKSRKSLHPDFTTEPPEDGNGNM